MLSWRVLKALGPTLRITDKQARLLCGDLPLAGSLGAVCKEAGCSRRDLFLFLCTSPSLRSFLLLIKTFSLGTISLTPGRGFLFFS